ncbi:hypothetical protein HNQ50_000151 [Silvimonas terrae]|uniref:Uncharacterized protein n=1 Tax=Silvimonas terrae TaxID=300266 RepID=A0A840RAW0_9NEIS|nr:hypothetical protein [Silvimonas terrae]
MSPASTISSFRRRPESGCTPGKDGDVCPIHYFVIPAKAGIQLHALQGWGRLTYPLPRHSGESRNPVRPPQVAFAEKNFLVARMEPEAGIRGD